MILPRRTGDVVIAAVACALLGGAPAHAKGDVHATFDDPSRVIRAGAGERVPVAFRLAVAPRAGAPAHAFGASGIYVRVRGSGGGPSRIVAAGPPVRGRGNPDGRYVADVTVPEGGIGSIAVGLEAYRSVRGGALARADVLFPIDNDPFAAARPGTAGNGARPLWGSAALALIAVALLLAATRALGTWRQVA